MATEKRMALFGDLGKATMRGVRKCPKCGTLNGTRGISCKNKFCDVVFKERDKKKTHSADAVKIITGSTVQVFSIRLRDRGPDYRGFVQLPLVQDVDGNPTDSVDADLLAQAARCYVDSCTRSNNSQLVGEPCSHIKSAINCNKEAQPCTLKNSVLNSLQVPNEMKQSIWLLATETTGPLVQRVTKNIMVVKCKPNPKQPLGFLHFSFFETSRNRTAPEYKSVCSCRAYKNIKPFIGKEDIARRCVHYYACISAFASDEKLAEEFSNHILQDETVVGSDSQMIIYNTQSDEDTTAESDIIDSSVDPSMAFSGATSVEVVIDEDGLITATEQPPAKRVKVIDELTGGAEVVQAGSALITLQDTPETITSLTETPSSTIAISPGNHAVTSKATSLLTSTPRKELLTASSMSAATVRNFTPKKLSHHAIDESQVSTSFYDWLGSVTERVNQTMHYQFDGNPDPLVFHAQQVFFDCLQQRISAGSKKKRLPNFTTGFVRRDALPLGVFTKYTWHITNILHVKQIFDTPLISLEITRSFVENSDGTYDLFEAPSIDDQGDGGACKIRPYDLKTYLKIGNTSPDQTEPTPFIIEWIPDILPSTHIGELRIKFEYGHQRNGQIVIRKAAANQGITKIIQLVN